MAYALSKETMEALQRRRGEIDQVFQKYAEAHPELAGYQGHKGCASWADDGWEDDPA